MDNKCIFLFCIFLPFSSLLKAQPSNQEDLRNLLIGKWELVNIEINKEDTIEKEMLKEYYLFSSDKNFYRELLLKDSSYINFLGKYKLNTKKKLIICLVDTVTFILRPPNNFKVNIKLKKSSIFRKNSRIIRTPTGFYCTSKKKKFHIAKLTDMELLIGRKGEDDTYLKYKKVK